MIKSFQHKGLRLFFETGSMAGIQPSHTKRLRVQLAALDAAQSVEEIPHAPGWKLHQLTGNRQGQWSVTVTGNWRITFEFHNEDAYLLNYEDYH